MKRLSLFLVAIILLLGFTSCKKEGMNIIGCECYDGSKIPSTNPDDCKGRLGFRTFLYGTGSFCDHYGTSAWCLGRNY